VARGSPRPRCHQLNRHGGLVREGRRGRQWQGCPSAAWSRHASTKLSRFGRDEVQRAPGVMNTSGRRFF
jgi:hypothetical protein